MTGSLASQIRFRNAVVTALAAILAVVLITTSAPMDKVSAERADPDAEVTARATAWWALLSVDQRTQIGVNPANVNAVEPPQLIKNFVDAIPTTDGDVYAVGDQLTDERTPSSNYVAIRGFQSVDLWWYYMTCEEKNIATGTDNAATTEGEGFCRNYSDLDAASRQRADEVGVAILQIDEPGQANSDYIENAANWWSHIAGINKAGVTIGNDLLLAAIDMAYVELSDHYRALVNDRWKYAYDEGGTDIEAWWNKLNCSQRVIAAGERSAPPPTDPQATWCMFANYRALVHLPADNTDVDDALGVFDRGFTVIRNGSSILGLRTLPDAARWWNTLSETERVNVIFGDPPVLYSDDKTSTTPLTAEDRAKVQVPFDELEGGVEWDTISVNTSSLALAMETLMLRQKIEGDWCIANNMYFDPFVNPCTLSAPEGVSYKRMVESIAWDILDPPRPGLDNGGAHRLDEFDAPYDSVLQWWRQMDCRAKRLAVGEDHNPLDTDESSAGGYCRPYPGDPTAMDSTQWMPAASYARVHEIARAIGVRPLGSPIVRPDFNEPATAGNVWIDGPAVVGGTLMVNDFSTISDPDGVPSDATYTYQWLRDSEPIPGATASTYVVTEADTGAFISAQLSFADGEYFPETVTTKSTSQIAFGGVPDGLIARIEPGIRSVTVSAGDEVVLNVNIYGLQGIHDQSLGNGVIFTWMQDGNAIDGMNSSLTYTAPASPGAYMIVATVGEEDCVPADRADMETACSAEFEVRVRRPAAPQPADEPPVNPPGEIPTILTDGQGAQYEVFTPVEGGTFDAGEGYSIMAPSGAVPNGEYIGVRMSDDGMASNAGVTSHRYTLGGNMYGIHAVDSTGASVTDYVLEDPARVCVPLPDVLRAQISDLALVTINSDNTLTILAANVRLGTSGTSVCGNLSNLPASVAVGSFGAPDAIPTATPEPTPIPPETGASSPTSNSAVWALLLGITVLILGSFVILGRRRGNIRA